jgi:hydroxyacylglutathione hydrolase
MNLGISENKMTSEIKTIALHGVNCYLVKMVDGFILIDTEFPYNRDDLIKELEKEGCLPGNLKLIVITHRDWDHTGNCAYLQEKYKVKIAMHKADASGEQSTYRKMKPFFLMIVLLPKMMRILPMIRKNPLERFEPDLFLEEGQSLADYGFNARILYIPGHTKGSIAILTENGDLFCGDIIHDSYINKGKPVFAQIFENESDLNASIEKLKMLSIKTVYPGHGKPFPWSSLQTIP